MRTRFITSAADRGGFPALGLPEFAFLGRSNVGKSALLNALVGARVARISKTPGRTQLINFFEVTAKGGRRYALADLPGYGFAAAPREVQAAWRPLVESYLETRRELKAALLLVDLRRGAEEDDEELVAWLEAYLAPRGVETELVGTKADKLGKSHIKPALARIARELGLEGRATATSATSRLGLEELFGRLEAIAGGVAPLR